MEWILNRIKVKKDIPGNHAFRRFSGKDALARITT
jgi:hypothetical protein